MIYSDSEIKSYFKSLNRRHFMDMYQDSADYDRAVPIGYGQTISQPSLVLLMTQQLKLQPDSKVLEIGTGSGFQTALLSEFSNSVYTVERIKVLHHSAKKRLKNLGYSNIHFHYGDGHNGWKEHAPYDRIMVTAASDEIPRPLIDQLAAGGRMIIPVGEWGQQALKLVEKDKTGNINTSNITYVMFVEFKDGIE